jgi:GT2 family glycosyltransferase/SAM-dependent methyltransferase
MSCLVAIVIVTYNSRGFLPELFESLRAHTDLTGVKILVVDNASSDGTLALLEEVAGSLPQLEVLPQSVNSGFAGGCNIGIRRARALGARYVQLLNPDTVVTAGWLEEVVRVLEAHPEAGTAQPLIMLFDEPELINSAGVAIHFCGFGYCAGYRRRREELSGGVGSGDAPRSLSYASGAAMLLRMSALDHVGDFDETLFLYQEDCDLQIRMRQAGYRCLLVPTACVFHKYNAEFSARKYAWLERNRWLVLLKDWPLPYLLASAPALLGVEAAVLLFALHKGWLGEKLWAYRELVAHLPKTLTERRRVQALRLPDDLFAHHLAGEMAVAGMDHPIMTHFANPLLSAYWSVARAVLSRSAKPLETSSDEYARRLESLEGAWWKRLVDVQALFRWNLRRLRLGRTLEIGCGLGRNLAHLEGRGVGVDHNAQSVAIARARGFEAWVPEEFFASEWNRPESFDSLLLSHVAEHMYFDEVAALLRRYLPLLRGDGQVIVITPQEAGYRFDPTHVEFFDFERVEELFATAGLEVLKRYSFPFPRSAGHVFKYNEFVTVGRKPQAVTSSGLRPDAATGRTPPAAPGEQSPLRRAALRPGHGPQGR